MKVLFFHDSEEAEKDTGLVWAALFTAWHYTRPGPGGQPLPLVALGTAPTRIDGAVHISKLFRDTRIDRAGGGFDPKPGPFRFLFQEEGHFAMLREWWTAYAGEIVHNVAAEQVKLVNEALEGKLDTVICREFTVDEWADFRLEEKKEADAAIAGIINTSAPEEAPE